MTWELIPESAPGASNGPSGSTSKRFPWWSLLAVGVIVALIGLGLVIWPFFAASRILAFLVGAAFMANGLAALVGTRARGVGVPAAIFLLVIGLIAVLLPDVTVRVLVSFVAMLLLGAGIIWLLFALRLRGAIRTATGDSRSPGPLSIIAPSVLIALGAAAIIWPDVALSVAAVAAGGVTLLIGGSLIWGSLKLRNHTPQSFRGRA